MHIASKSEAAFEKAKHHIPGGVNSPVRAFKGVGGHPIFMKEAKGSYLFDIDGNRYIDLINSWGPMVLGHAHEAVKEAVIKAAEGSFSFGAPTEREIEMAEKIKAMVPSIELVRMVNSGTEATMSAIRLARGYTGRDKIIKFEGCYHGHGDSFLIAAGSGVATLGIPDSPGVPVALAKETLVATYNDLASVETLFEGYPNQISCLIIEPVVGNMGLVVPQDGFLQGLRTLCTKHGALLVLDEVMTGFRLAKGGAQEIYGIDPDITTLGKIIGGGLPVGAYGGKLDIMNSVAPAGKIYQAGTLSGNPIAMAAGLAMLNLLDNDPGIYASLEANGARLEAIFRKAAKAVGQDYTVNRVGSMCTLFFNKAPVTNWHSAKASDTALFGKFFHHMLTQGVYLAPSQFESLFINAIMTEQDFELLEAATLASMEAAMLE